MAKILVILALIAFILIFSRIIQLALQDYQGDDRGSRINFGERHVASILSQLPEEYHVFNDVYLTSNDNSIQIDHIVISPYGIFIIETKDYAGHIWGSENGEKWTQSLHGNKYTFYNPIRQNKLHAIAFHKMIGVTPKWIFQVVVFSHRAYLDCKTTSTVVYASDLLKYILSKRDTVFSEVYVNTIIANLTKTISVDPNREEKHVQLLKKKMADREELIEKRICPQCGGKLIERKGNTDHSSVAVITLTANFSIIFNHVISPLSFAHSASRWRG